MDFNVRTYTDKIMDFQRGFSLLVIAYALIALVLGYQLRANISFAFQNMFDTGWQTHLFKQPYQKLGYIREPLQMTKVAFGMGITYRHINKALADNPDNINNLLEMSPFFVHFIPTLCLTIEKNYLYKIFMMHDYNDIIFSNTAYRENFRTLFTENVHRHCGIRNLKIHLQVMQCNHTGKPARAQNDAMMAAYNAGYDYFYMANDDERFSEY